MCFFFKKILFFFFFFYIVLYSNSFIDEFSKISKTTRISSLGGQNSSDFNGVEAIGIGNSATIYQENIFAFLVSFNNSPLFDYNLISFAALFPINEFISVGTKLNSLGLSDVLETKNGTEINTKNLNFADFTLSISYKLFDFLYLGFNGMVFSTDEIILDKLVKFDFGILFLLNVLSDPPFGIDFLQLGLDFKNIDSPLYGNAFISGDFQVNGGITILLQKLIQQKGKIVLETSGLEAFVLGGEYFLFDIFSLRSGINIPYQFFIGQVGEYISLGFGADLSIETKVGIHEVKIIPSYALNFKTSVIENYFQFIIEFIPGKEEKELTEEDIFGM